MLEASVTRFIAQESFLLDDCKWQEWSALFDEEGHYWMPAHPQQTDPINHVSHIYESASLRDLRIRRLNDTLALSLSPAPRVIRHISNLLVEKDDDTDEIKVRASLLASQYAYESVQQFHATATWTLREHEGSYRIILKRIDLLNSDGWLSDILQYL